MIGPLKKRRRRRRFQDRWDLSKPLFYLADGVPWTIGDSFQGVQVFGATGAGKSMGAVKCVSGAYLEAGYGGIFFTTKVEDRDLYIQYARDAGREDDVHIFSPAHDLRFNFIEDERSRSKDGVGLVENLTELIMTVAQLGDRRGGGTGGGGDNEKYFREEATRLTRNGLLVLVASGESLTIFNLHRVITSAPLSMEQVSSTAWQEGSFCFHCLQAADKAPLSASMRADLELAFSHLLREWPALSSRTRSVVQSTLTSATDLLSRGVARDLLSSPAPNISPAMMYDGAILIVDLPVLRDHEMGRMVQVVMKYIWQRAHGSRDVSKNNRPTFMIADEAQMLLVDSDHEFQAIARSTRTAVVYVTQSISSYLDTLGPHSEAKVHTLLGNLQTRICHQQTDVKTIEYMQQLVGRSRQMMVSGNTSHDSDWLTPLVGGKGSGSAGLSEVYEYELQARDLNSLAKGGPPHWITEAIVYQGGRTFPNGKTWLRVGFSQLDSNTKRK